MLVNQLIFSQVFHVGENVRIQCISVFTCSHWGFPCGASGKEPASNTGHIKDVGLIPGSGRFPGGGNGNPHQYSCLENLHGQRSLVGYSPWGIKELDMTEVT